MADLIIPGVPDAVTVNIFNGKTSAVSEYDGTSLNVSGVTLNAILKSLDTAVAALQTADINIATSQVDDITSLTLAEFTGNTTLDDLLEAIDTWANTLASTSITHDASGYSFLDTGSANVDAVLDDIDTKLNGFAGTSVAISDGAFSNISGATAQLALGSADSLITTNISNISSNSSAITALQNADQTEVNTLTIGGGTISLDPASNKKFQYVKGTATITSNWTIQTAGTPANGDEFWVFYDAAITPTASETVTIFGTTLTDAEALSATILFIAKYSDSGWRYLKLVDSDYLSANIQRNHDVVAVSASPYPASANETLLVNASGGSITVNLPAAAVASGREINVKKTDATGNSVILDGNLAETIDGAATQSITTQYESLRVVSDGSNWHIV